jgi:glycosyltransferase involved in cell wall biosynthesis
VRALIESVLPIPVRRGLSAFREAVSGLPALPRVVRRGLAGRAPSGKPAVYLGFDRIPSRGERLHGGMVKLQALEERHPNTPAAFNLLYLVSSAVPRHAAALTWAARRRRVRLVWNQNGVAYPGWQPHDWRRMNRPLARLLPQADHVFYQSQFCKTAADRFLGPPHGSWEILHNAADSTVFTPAEVDPAPGRLVLLLGGSQDQLYRVDVALRVLRALRAQQVDASLLVTGRLGWTDAASARLAFAARADELGVAKHIELLGPYTQAEAPALFRRAHVLLHTKYNDPCPALVVEAMACGLPVVYSSSGGVPELVGPAAGVGVPAELDWDREVPPDPEKMADAVATVAAARERYAAAARERAVQALDVTRWLARHDDVFTRLAFEGA